MQPPSPDPRRRRVLVLAAAMAVVLGAIMAVRAATAPDEVEVCERVLELAALAGEAAGEAERLACERHYAALRERLGPLEWAALAQCTVVAKTMSDAGGC